MGGTGQTLNTLGQPIGRELPGFQPPPRPPRAPLAGHWCRVEPLSAAGHGADLWMAYADDVEGRVWTYLASGPFRSDAEFAAFVASREPSTDPLFFAIVDAATGRAAGMASYLRIEPAHGSIEVGHLAFSPRLQRTRAATEAMYLMMKQAFDLGYRRYEWKCDALNSPSRRAAERLGFRHEGTFRQATVYKGRNRDTAWYSIIDAEWPAQAARFEAWLDPGNFDAAGQQRRPLSGG